MIRLFPFDNPELIERQRDLLTEIHGRGKVRFILVHGTVWAASFFVVFVVSPKLMGVMIFSKAIDWGFFPIGLAIALAAGYGHGFWMWNHYEKKYRELSGRS